ncbi:MAG: RnfH family protein [Betaproteobacteria bacterium]|nr:RnfH family protein [Betaproteobacteria bacterium]NBY06153.1 RnfH family protein [Betaproteobacteria bacterium]
MAHIEVTLVYSPASRVVHELVLQLPKGCNVSEAWRASQWFSAMENPSHSFCPESSVWGRKVSPTQTLNDGDRLEALRPLKVDPKEARRQRFAQQGARAAGLFARRRPGAKPGY